MRLRPVAPAGTSSLLKPFALASGPSRNRWGVDPSCLAISIAVRDTAGLSS